jgi:hypothetical protein
MESNSMENDFLDLSEDENEQMEAMFEEMEKKQTIESLSMDALMSEIKDLEKLK